MPSLQTQFAIVVFLSGALMMTFSLLYPMRMIEETPTCPPRPTRPVRQRPITKPVLTRTKDATSTVPNSIQLSEICHSMDAKIAIVNPYWNGSQVIATISRWDDPLYSPCDLVNFNQSESRFDLMFYFHGSEEAQIGTKDDILKAMGRSKKCFRNIRFDFSNLNNTGDPRADPTRQFYELWEVFASEDFPYDYFFLMEADTYPIRPNWLHKVFIECACRDPFWVKGSTYWLMDWYVYKTLGVHINGNALYNTKDRRFYEKVIKDVRSDLVNAFDMVLYRWFQPDPRKLRRNLELATPFQQYYVHSDFIINWAHSNWTIGEMQERGSQLHFVHSKALQT